jgi:hypothetical protein
MAPGEKLGLVVASCCDGGHQDDLARVEELADAGAVVLARLAELPEVFRYAVSVTPDLEAGDAGWCSFPEFFVGRSATPMSAGQACAPADDGSVAIVAGGAALTNVLSDLAPRPTANVTGVLPSVASSEQALRSPTPTFCFARSIRRIALRHSRSDGAPAAAGLRLVR